MLLVAFTHYPAVATLYHSLLSTPKAGRPAVWVGLENYRAMAGDPVFWQSLRNNVLFAPGTIPTSMALALSMALLVNQNLRGRARPTRLALADRRLGAATRRRRSGSAPARQRA